MKKIILILLLAITNSNADYAASGSGASKGEAYVDAMGKAPSGNHWILSKIHYSGGNFSRYVCTVIWKQK